MLSSRKSLSNFSCQNLAFRNSRKLDYKEISKKLLSMGPAIVAIFLYKDGCFVSNDGEEYFIESRIDRIQDMVGAEDAFITGFLYGYLKNYDLYKCGEIGK